MTKKKLIQSNMNLQTEAVATTATTAVTPTPTTTRWCERNNEKIFAPTEETILAQMNRVTKEMRIRIIAVSKL